LEGQNHRDLGVYRRRSKNGAKVVGATSGEGFLVRSINQKECYCSEDTRQLIINQHNAI